MPNQPNPKIPQHVAFIMDGNGRWATKRGLPRLAGHSAGVQNVRPVIFAAAELGIRYVTFYAFSTENWRRPEAEVAGLMALFAAFIDDEAAELHKAGVRILHIGYLEGLNETLQQKVRSAIELTKNNTGITAVLAFNYGGRDEIVHAIRKLIAEGKKPEEVTENTVSQALFTAGIPDPDLVIRTSGELRTSNFLIWQSAYSEWAFPTIYWPDFNKQALAEILQDYGGRERRFGGLTES